MKIGVQKLLAEIPAQIRSGSTMARKILGELEYEPARANSVQASPLRQQPVLTALLAKLGNAAVDRTAAWTEKHEAEVDHQKEERHLRACDAIQNEANRSYGDQAR